MIRSLFSKLLLSHLIVLIVTTASIGILLSHLMTNYLIEAKQTELMRQGTTTAAFLDASLQDTKLLPRLLNNLGDLSGTKLWIMSKDNTVFAGDPPRRWQHRMSKNHNSHVADNSPPSNNMRQRSLDFFTNKANSWIYRSRNDDDPSIVVAIGFPSSPDLALFIYTSINGIAKTSNAILELLLYSILGAMLLAGVCAFFLSRNLTRPIHSISKAAANFAAGDYTCRATTLNQDEIGKLGNTFNDMADALSRIENNRREFFSDVTHELKTPIASIQAVTESILDGIVTDEKSKNRYLNIILNETRHMNHLISDLLNLAQIESGQLQFDFQSVSINDFLRQQQDKYTPLLADKQQTILLELSPEPIIFKIDALRLDQILTNLISNASRHSPANSIVTLGVTTCKNQIVISVTDYGEGIPAADLPYLWERFYKVDKARTRNNAGTGLGLSITKKLVEGMKGTISVDSTPHKRTEFRITLPLK